MITIGMNYEILDGKEKTFEEMFTRVVETMSKQDHHVRTGLYKSVESPGTYLVVSTWDSRKAFDAFVASEEFARVTKWGRENVLAGRPTHEVYGSGEPLSGSAPAECPVAVHG